MRLSEESKDRDAGNVLRMLFRRAFGQPGFCLIEMVGMLNLNGRRGKGNKVRPDGENSKIRMEHRFHTKENF